MKKVTEIEGFVENIIEFQKEIDAYEETKNQIKVLKRASYNFYKKAQKVKTENDMKHVVNEYVIAVNKVNESADYSLIETMEREDIYTFIENVCELYGYTFDYDITEEYREW